MMTETAFSGSTVEDGGKLYLYYTGVRYIKEDPENTNLCKNDQFISAQRMIISGDGFHFDNIMDKKTFIPPMNDPLIGDKQNTRYPKVWRGKEAWYMVIGSCTEDQRGKLLFYKSKDLYWWDFLNTTDKELGWMWECPDYFEVRQKKIIFSPLRLLNDGRKEESQSICTIVEFEEESCTMKIPDTYQFLVYGLGLYAFQSTVDEKGRRIVTAWARMPEAPDGSWNGMFCIPRVVEAEKGHIYFRVHPNVKKAYTRKIKHPQQASEAGYRAELTMEDGEELSIGGYRIRTFGRLQCR